MTDTSATTPEPVAPLSDWEMKAVAQAKLEAELFTLNKGALLDALALAGVTRVVVSFDGYGDSGQIENVEVQAGDDQVAMPGAAIEFSEAIWDQAEPRRSSAGIAAVDDAPVEATEADDDGEALPEFLAGDDEEAEAAAPQMIAAE